MNEGHQVLGAFDSQNARPMNPESTTAENTNEGHMFRHKSAEMSGVNTDMSKENTHVHHKVGPYLLLL